MGIQTSHTGRFLPDDAGPERPDLDWYWREWIYETARLDQAVDSVSVSKGGGNIIHLSNGGTILMPVELRLTFVDGGAETVKLPVDAWNPGNHFDYLVAGARRVTAVEVDPRRALPDVNRTNDNWRH